MGERFESFDNKPTAQISPSQELDDSSFSYLSETVEGLSQIESEDILAEFITTRDNKEDIFYIYKFISSAETFNKISKKDLDLFPNLKEEDYFEVIERAKLMQNIFIIPPVFCKVGDLKANKKSIFIAVFILVFIQYYCCNCRGAN